MKKQALFFETNFWAGHEITDPFEVLDSLIAYAHIDYYKQMLSDAVLYAQKQEVYNKEEPGQLFMCHAVLRSFFRACSKLESKSKKRHVIKCHASCNSILHQASLNKEEYNNPLIVFKNAFAENSVKDYDYFFSLMVEMALSHHELDYDSDLFTYYIHIVKMLDAAQLLHERGIEKSKKEAELPIQVLQETSDAIEENSNASTMRSSKKTEEKHIEPQSEITTIGVEQHNNQNQITTLITSTIPIYGIYCFGEREIKESFTGLHCEAKQSSSTHYYLLVIVSTLPQNDTADLAHLIKMKTQAGSTATLLLHTLKDLRRDKTKQASFFQKIVFEGVTWFEDWSNTTPLNLSGPVMKDWKEIEMYWFNRKIIVDGLMDAAESLDPNDAAVLKVTFLHQAVEQLCLGLIHTFLGYRPHHFALGYLFDLCDLFTPIASQLFPRKTKEELAFLKPLFRSINDMRHLKTLGKNTPQLPLIQERCLAFCEQSRILVEIELARLKELK